MLWSINLTRIMCVVILGLVVVLDSSPVVGQENWRSTATWTGTWGDADLSVTVVARGHIITDDIRATQPWWMWGNTSTDAYLFQWSDDRLVDLIVDFSMNGNRPTARIYVPVIQSNRLGVQVGDGEYTVPDTLLPDLVLWPREGDWLVDGLPNFNLEGTESDQITGVTKWAFRVGSNEPGVPDWITRRLVDDVDSTAGYPRFEAAVRADISIRYEMVEPLMPSWPLLSAVNREDHWGKIQPLFFDPVGRVLHQNWAGFHIAGMYQINSISYPPETNFESPFAFYQFDRSAGRYANMVIRSDIWPEGSTFGPPPYTAQRTAVRMTWTEEQPDLWRYSLTMTGNHVPETEVLVGDTVVNAVPYDDYPSWITSRSWKAVTFVEAMSGERGSEGIYEYSVEDNYPVAEWVNGLSSEPPTSYADVSETGLSTSTTIQNESVQTPHLSYPAFDPQRLEPGFRGEYSLVYKRQPRLYLSPVDGLVHLLYAQGGGWKLGARQVLRISNMNGDAFIDSWIRERVPLEWDATGDGTAIAMPPVVEEALYEMNGYLLYSSDDTVELRKIADTAANQDVRIPTDKESWERFLSESGAGTSEGRSPHDLKSWLNVVPGESVWSVKGHASDVRFTPNGFRFVLTLHEAMGSRLPGEYVVSYDGEFTIVLLSPPALSATISTSPLTQLESGVISVNIRNDGLEDITDATLEVWGTPGSGEPMLIAEETVALLAGTSIRPAIDWAPPISGPWFIETDIYLSKDKHILTQGWQVSVVPVEAVTARDLLSDVVAAPAVAGGVALIVFAALAALTGWRQWPVSASRKD